VASSCNARTIPTFSDYVCFRHLLKAHCLIEAAALPPCINFLTNLLLLLGGPILVLTPCSLTNVMLAVQLKQVLFLWRLSVSVGVCLSVCTITKNYSLEIDVTCYKYVLWWNQEMLKSLVTSDLDLWPGELSMQGLWCHRMLFYYY